MHVAKHKDLPVIVDSLRPLLARHYSKRASEAIAQLPDFDRFVSRIVQENGEFVGIKAFGPSLGIGERYALAEVEEAGALSPLWAPARDTLTWIQRARFASEYRRWKRFTRNVRSSGSSAQAKLSREWEGVLNSSFYSLELLPNGRIENDGGRWWTKRGTRTKSGGRYDILCMQKKRAADAQCADYLVERSLELDGGKLLLYWGNEVYEAR
jgi:hypothetical protein